MKKKTTIGEAILRHAETVTKLQRKDIIAATAEYDALCWVALCAESAVKKSYKRAGKYEDVNIHPHLVESLKMALASLSQARKLPTTLPVS